MTLLSRVFYCRFCSKYKYKRISFFIEEVKLVVETHQKTAEVINQVRTCVILSLHTITLVFAVSPYRRLQRIQYEDT